MVLVSLLNLFCPAWISPNLLPNHPSKDPCPLSNLQSGGKGFLRVLCHQNLMTVALSSPLGFFICLPDHTLPEQSEARFCAFPNEGTLNVSLHGVHGMDTAKHPALQICTAAEQQCLPARCLTWVSLGFPISLTPFWMHHYHQGFVHPHPFPFLLTNSSSSSKGIS